jgi:hypothetical protein
MALRAMMRASFGITPNGLLRDSKRKYSKLFTRGRDCEQVKRPTIYEALATKLGRIPTNAELRADVQRIKDSVLVELASKGKLSHQRKVRS